VKYPLQKCIHGYPGKVSAEHTFGNTALNGSNDDTFNSIY